MIWKTTVGTGAGTTVRFQSLDRSMKQQWHLLLSLSVLYLLRHQALSSSSMNCVKAKYHRAFRVKLPGVQEAEVPLHTAPERTVSARITQYSDEHLYNAELVGC